MSTHSSALIAQSNECGTREACLTMPCKMKWGKSRKSFFIQFSESLFSHFASLCFHRPCSRLSLWLFPGIWCLHEDMILSWYFYKTTILCFVYSMFVVCYQNDGNSKLIISAFFRLFYCSRLPHNSTQYHGTRGKIAQVQSMWSMSWTSRRSRTMIWSLEQQIAYRVSTPRFHYQLRFQVSTTMPWMYLYTLISCLHLFSSSSLDVNDCPPTLPQDNYDITVSESAPFGSVILKVTAQDNDGPGNSNLFLLGAPLHYILKLNVTVRSV